MHVGILMNVSAEVCIRVHACVWLCASLLNMWTYLHPCMLADIITSIHTYAHVCICVWLHVDAFLWMHVYVYMHEFVFVCLYLWLFVCMHASVCLKVCQRVNVCACVSSVIICVCKDAWMHKCVWGQENVLMCVCMHMHMLWFVYKPVCSCKPVWVMQLYACMRMYKFLLLCSCTEFMCMCVCLHVYMCVQHAIVNVCIWRCLCAYVCKYSIMCAHACL